MNNAKDVGFKKGIIFNFGNFVGHFSIMIVCLIFSAALYTIIPKIQFPMKILGSVYLIYLIIKTLVPSKKQEIKHNNGSFIIGALLQLVNPKIIIFGMTVMSLYILPYYKETYTLLLFAFLLSCVQFTGNICWTLFGSFASRLFSKHGKILNIIMALLLLYCIIKLYI
jgi:threonine/homoserine/homoserine lactone efflux protein